MLGPMSEPREVGGTQRHILKVTRQQTVAPSHSRPAAGCSLEAVGNSWEVWGGAGRAAGTPVLLHRPVSSGLRTQQTPCSSAGNEHCHVGRPSPEQQVGQLQGLRLHRDPLCGRSWSVETKVGVRQAHSSFHSLISQPVVTSSSALSTWGSGKWSLPLGVVRAHLGNGSGNSSPLGVVR